MPKSNKSFWYSKIKALRVGESFEVPAHQRKRRGAAHPIAAHFGYRVSISSKDGTSFVKRIR